MKMPIHSQTSQAPTRAQAGGQWAEVGFWGPGLGDKRPGGQEAWGLLRGWQDSGSPQTWSQAHLLH